MKNCIITPTRFINDERIGRRSDFLLVLSHLLDNDCTNDYAKAVRIFQRDTGRPIYLDNGLFENHTPERGESLLRKAILLNAEYVFAPDVLYDREATEEEFRKFNLLKEEYEADIKLAYVVQASNPIEYLQAYKWAEENPNISMIGLSILTLPFCFAGLDHSRDAFAEISEARLNGLMALQLVLNPKKDAHLLGLGDNPVLELDTIRLEHSFVKSNDSCSAYMTGLKGFTYGARGVPGGKVVEKVEFNSNIELTEDQYSNIIININEIKNTNI